MRLSNVLSVTLLTSIVSSNPVATPQERGVSKRDEVDDDLYDMAERVYSGIWWYSARKTCTKEKFEGLVDALRGATSMVNSFLDQDVLENIGKTPDSVPMKAGFHKFFVQGPYWQSNSV
jgi:hypothetical protein